MTSTATPSPGEGAAEQGAQASPAGLEAPAEQDRAGEARGAAPASPQATQEVVPLTSTAATSPHEGATEQGVQASPTGLEAPSEQDKAGEAREAAPASPQATQEVVVSAGDAGESVSGRGDPGPSRGPTMESIVTPGASQALGMLVSGWGDARGRLM